MMQAYMDQVDEIIEAGNEAYVDEIADGILECIGLDNTDPPPSLAAHMDGIRMACRCFAEYLENEHVSVTDFEPATTDYDDDRADPDVKEEARP